ncbi:5-carboxymethyl-2-hydroxymuconate Delta-isomerase [Pseudoalteromonas sp. MMG013]|uniref:5-carboxymethyl-2-hydroxymuconate isomerase n=1 Tax=Pseudoalteromonas aurantia 208 TaxID=1314867 RepID=A0ABR9EFP0_9GAMM|nr:MULTISPECIES: 5-carboxymethyl-2-hydroxymuconate Delta-isomerase [Pseudoalteromonas]MBE0369572.1 5-carboxymethyl-2-hydroxymuconate isomerase [Pseudoalteromonas aurantia 208]MBQ4844109.1 5-carboxymethyl-2-hydroxymuconate Delta-isomerase [Pseudoalteromonas sp. MMG005]MBQ4861191.1 5-carboxymethyl-2-hydroxymuconate Delta-isomerase [Pseudoalteromonas sp. MMG013]
MPHLIIEHSHNLPICDNDLLESLHNAAASTLLFDPSMIKSRLIQFQQYKLGNEKCGFVHVQAHIMTGRTIEQKQHLSDTLFQQLQIQLTDKWQLSVHIYDLIPQIYRKN